MRNVWIVMGETGEYSDYREWNVAGYTTEEEAEKHKNAAQREADKVNNGDIQTRHGFKNAYDTQFYCDYTGTRYNVVMVEVHESFNSQDFNSQD